MCVQSVIVYSHLLIAGVLKIVLTIFTFGMKYVRAVVMGHGCCIVWDSCGRQVISEANTSTTGVDESIGWNTHPEPAKWTQHTAFVRGNADAETSI